MHALWSQVQDAYDAAILHWHLVTYNDPERRGEARRRASELHAAFQAHT